MLKKQNLRILTPEIVDKYIDFLREQEKSVSTVHKYIYVIGNFCKYMAGRTITKTDVIVWKEELTSIYASASVNTMIAAVNGLFAFFDWMDLKVRPLKIQRSLFCDERKELNRAEYTRLVNTAQKDGNERLSLVLQTICATGIRVSELQYITAEAVHSGKAEINNKGKRRTIFLPGKLCRSLKNYSRKQKRTVGCVFVTKTGKPLDRSNIWREMKALCKSAGVEAGKVFPHNLRHLFARTYYSLEKDLSRLADILGHSNVNTTRIYTIESGSIHATQIERLGLIIT